ncbi:MAG: 3-dehydroquinate synthase [Candidatus Bathyarchaeia archaeon]
MRILKIKLKREVDESYDIFIENGLVEKISHDLKKNPLGNKYAVVTDSNVQKIYGEELLKRLEKERISACLINFPAGEEFKNLETVSYLVNELSKNRLDRKSAIIALGGGVVGDVAGFTASIYMRGISYIQVPTTLLAQVDSSIGGKTAVDTNEGKNLIGSFYQPKKVYIDPNTLRTLSKEEFRNGLAEIIKYGVIYDRDFFEYLEENIGRINGFNQEVLAHVIWNSCRIKKEIVEEDPKEENKRSILNYGHTPAHAIEKLSNYKVSHGEAVAIGMNFSGSLAVKKGFWKRDELERQKNLLKTAGFRLNFEFEPLEFIKTLYHDKKAEDEAIKFVFPESIGKMATIDGRYRISVSEEELEDYIFKEVNK